MREVSSALFGSEILTGDLEDFPALLSARFPFGKYLVLTDEESAFPVLETLKNLPKKIQLVIRSEDDAVPLFHLSDGITCVVGAGKRALWDGILPPRALYRSSPSALRRSRSVCSVRTRGFFRASKK